ncbi:MAG: VWA domain-containing protein [Synechococcaceae cyanobacterium SM1_2_3]|nr:VWA domain-containing protein [Synechococcaceae cyanobacterium SM1_2_3]
MNIAKGQRLPVAQIIAGATRFQLGLSASAPGMTLDFACFGLNGAGVLADDRYMTFFNQPRTPCGAVELATPASDAAGFNLQLTALPKTIERLVITAALEGKGTMGQLQEGWLRFLDAGKEVARFTFRGSDFADERALMLGEFYRKEDTWRFCATAQGFNGGLDALVRHFGGAVAEESPAPTPVSSPSPPSASTARISLEKRIEREAPRLVSLVKQAAVSLEKAGLADHRAKVCLCLDISGSMRALYQSGAVQAFADRILALACRFDDDGEIDVFLFGEEVHQPAPMNLANSQNYIRDLIQRYPLEGDTRYGAAMEAIRCHYFPDARGQQRQTPFRAQLPVYVMFLTDGSTSDKGLTEKQLRWSSYEPVFWQFMGIGKGRKSKSKSLFSFADSDFPFLEKLDELPGRLIDNADFFAVQKPDEHPDEELYTLLMGEYPQWVKAAKSKQLII